MEISKALPELEPNVLKGVLNGPNYCPLSIQREGFFLAILGKMDIYIQ